MLKKLAAFLILMMCVWGVHAQETTPDARVSACRALMVNPPPLGEAPPTIRFVSPEDGAAVVAPVEFTIETENMTFTEGNHWHLWVNGMLYGMIFEPRTVLDLPPGTYELCANLGDGQHMDMGVPDAFTLTIVAAGDGTPIPVIDPSIQPPTPEPSRSPLLLIGLIGAAAVGGVLIGSRLGRRTPLH